MITEFEIKIIDFEIKIIDFEIKIIDFETKQAARYQDYIFHLETVSRIHH